MLFREMGTARCPFSVCGVADRVQSVDFVGEREVAVGLCQ